MRRQGNLKGGKRREESGLRERGKGERWWLPPTG